MKRMLFLVLVFLSFLYACGPSWEYQDTKTLPDSGWLYVDTLHFELDITDTISRYNLYLYLEHTPSFPNQNVYLKIHTRYPSGETIADRLSIDLMDKQGKWYGKCSEQQCNLMVSLQEGLFFNQTGVHLLSLEQYTRSNPLSGILSAGMYLEKVTP